MNNWLVVGLIFFAVLLSGCLFDSCDAECRNRGYASGFCENVGTVPELIDEVEQRENATYLSGDFCLNDPTYLGSRNMCFCKSS